MRGKGCVFFKQIAKGKQRRRRKKKYVGVHLEWIVSELLGVGLVYFRKCNVVN